MIELKGPKSFHEQIEILKKRGLVICDYKRAEFILSNIMILRCNKKIM